MGKPDLVRTESLASRTVRTAMSIGPSVGEN